MIKSSKGVNATEIRTKPMIRKNTHDTESKVDVAQRPSGLGSAVCKDQLNSTSL